MSSPSAPQYPTPEMSALAASVQKPGLVPPRVTRVLLGLVLLGLLVPLAAKFYELWETRRAPGPPQALDFEVVEKRFAEVGASARREQDEALLGSPAERDTRGSQIAAWEDEVMLERGLEALPALRAWDTWVDPKNERKWVAILYVQDEVYARQSWRR